MKKIIALLTVISMLSASVAFASCDSSNTTDSSSVSTSESSSVESTESSSIDSSEDGSSSESSSIDSSEDSSSSESGSVSVATVTEVIITGDAVVYYGYETTLTATVTMSDNSVYSGEVAWTSSDESVATVTDGVVKGVAIGTANIAATADGVTSSAFTVTVSERPSDVVDAAGWVAAMTSEDILNSIATGTQISTTVYYTSGETVTNTSVDVGTNYYELTSTADGVTGKAYSLNYCDYNGSESTVEYYYIQEATYMRCYEIDSDDETDDCWIYDSDYTGLMGELFIQFMIADESYFGGDYFNYSEEEGAYVWQYTSGSSEYKYVVKIYDGNVVYVGMSGGSYYECEDYTRTYTSSLEITYTYGGVTVTIPDDIQSRLEALTVGED